MESDLVQNIFCGFMDMSRRLWLNSKQPKWHCLPFRACKAFKRGRPSGEPNCRHSREPSETSCNSMATFLCSTHTHPITNLYALNSASSSSPDYNNKRCKYTGQSVRALPVRILTVGKKRSPGVQHIVDDYVDKLRIYCAVEDIQIRSNPKNARDTVTQVNDEDMSIMNLIRDDDWVVILDERGKDLRSEQMADLIGDAGNQGSTKLLFCVGGPYGHGRRLRERANVSVKLSSMVLNHQIALVVLMEQLYRSWTIIKGQKYHH